MEYESTVDGIQPLHATVYGPEIPSKNTNPILVLVHDFRGSGEELFETARYYASKNITCIIPEMRGYNESAGERDFGCWEIFDIVDSIAEFYRLHPEYFLEVQPLETPLESILKAHNPNIHIWGFIGGGSIVYSALAKFPYLFRSAASFFGIADIAELYKLNLRKDFNVIMRKFIGGTPEQNQIAWKTRNNVNALKNTLTKLFVFWDRDNSIYPFSLLQPILELEQKNLFIYLTEKSDVYRWKPGYFNCFEDFEAAEKILLKEIETNPVDGEKGHFLIPKEKWSQNLQMKSKMRMIVAGYLCTPLFIAIVNTGREGVSEIKYEIIEQSLLDSTIKVEIDEEKGEKVFYHPIDSSHYIILKIFNLGGDTPFEIRFL